MAQTSLSATTADAAASDHHQHRNFWSLTIGSIGVVYGDIGTSPLYAFKEAINAAMRAASEGSMKGYLEYCEDPIVSNDVIGNPASSVVDALSTNVMSGDLVKVLSWYDNEWGFSNRVVDALLKMA